MSDNLCSQGLPERDLILNSAFGRNHSRNHRELKQGGWVNMQAAGLAGYRHSPTGCETERSKCGGWRPGVEKASQR